MMRHTLRLSCCARTLLVVALSGFACSAAHAALSVLGTTYQEDMLFPEFNCIYNNANYPTSCPSVVPGVNAHVYLKNDGGSSVTITDVSLAGYSLETIIKQKIQGGNDAYSIYYYWDEPPSDLIDAGEPVWYRVDPNPIPAGKTAQIVIRLRYVPVTPNINIGAYFSGGSIQASIPVNSAVPQIASVGFSKDLDKAYIHWRRSGGAAPTTILMDGDDITADCFTVSDSGFDFAVTEYAPPSPLGVMSYHVYQGIYADGKVATASLRSWVNGFSYGTYGAGETTTWNDARAWIDTCIDRGVNLLIWNNGSDGLVSFLNKPIGQEYAKDRGYGFMIDVPTKWNVSNPRFWYGRDEPDAHDWHLGCNDTGLWLPCPVESHNVGALATTEARTLDSRRTNYPNVPTSININATFMPYNYYTYGQLVDVGMSDPYYQARQRTAYWFSTKDIPLYERATYIYAVTRAMTAACEPNPTLIALCSAAYGGDTDEPWPYAAPGTKRTEAYYALAGGAKSMGYWWFLPPTGLGTYTEDALALWKEIGILGNEFKTAQPVIVTSNPVNMSVTPSSNLWAKPLVSGVDSLMLVCINENLYNDINGCNYTPLSNASVTMTLPSWLTSCSAFEISSEGVNSVATSLSGNQLTVTLGTVNLTRLIVLTTNPQLRSEIERRYLEKSYRGLCTFAPDYCTARPQCIQNPGGEDGFNQVSGGYIADGWTEWETVYATITGYDETSIVRSGGHSQRFKVVGTGGASGGAFQKIPASSGTGFSVSVWTRAGDGNTSCYLGVDPTGGTNPASGNVSWSSANSTTSWVQKTVAGTAGANLITVFYKVVTTDNNIHNGYFDDATPSCSGPSITGNPSNRVICPGANTTFTVTASAGSGSLSYQWLRNGAPLVNGGHYSGVTTATVTITGADTNDSGNYACVVTTAYGTATSGSASLSFTSAITQNPVDTSVCPGGNTSLTVTAVGASAYQWQKNSVNLSNGGHYSGCTTATLSISSADTNDVANYRCVVTGTCGTHTSTQAALTLKPVTSITAHPQAQDVVPTTTAQFTVTAAGAGTLTYQWQKNSANLNDGGHYSGCTTQTLIVSNADTNDTANYRCVVTGTCGSATSNQAALTLQSGTFITTQPLPANVCSGQSTQFSVVAWGEGTVTYRWQKNSVNLSNGGHYSGCTTATLTVSNINTNDVADYRCVATGATGTATSNQARLTINEYTAATNGNFEASTAAKPPVGWTTYVQSSKSGNWTIQTASPPEGTQYQQTQVYNVNCWGGIRQTITGLEVGSVYTLSGSYRSNSISGTASVRYNLSGDTNRTNSTVLVHKSTSEWVTFLGTVTATSGSITLFLDHMNGSSSNKASAFDNVKFTYLPVIFLQPSDASVCLGGNVNIGVSATGNNISYQWQKNSVNISDGGHYSGCNTAYLSITGADANDVANYRCVVTGNCGSTASNQAALTLKTATSITQQPSAQYICVGGNAQFTVSAAGEGILTYQWQKDEFDLSDTGRFSGVNTATLSITNANTDDDGNYRCIVTGTCGSTASNAAALTVSTGVAITQQPAPQNVCPGASAQFTVASAGDTPTYQWQKNGANLSNGGHYSGCTTATLTITGADGSDVADYRCVLTSMCGGDASEYASLTLKATTAITLQPVAQNVCAGQYVEFEVDATGAGTLTYQWQKNGANLSNGGHYAGCTTPVLSITGTDATDVANYRCVVTGTCGSANSNTAALTLRSGTSITGHPAAQNVCPGANVQFTVTATGDGTLAYQWQKNGANLSNGGHYSGCTTATLTVSGADGSDVANYRCVVTGNCGYATSNAAALSLKSATAITGHPSAQAICPGYEAIFNVTATGDGTLSYQWQKNSVNLNNGGHYSGCTTATLTVSNADTNDAGNYRCVVTGGCGNATSNTAALSLYGSGTLNNGNFEASTAANPPSGWTTYIQSTKSGNWTIQTVTPPEGTQWQQSQVYNINSWGGIRQNITGLTSGVVYTISGSYKTNSTAATASVRYNLSGDVNRTNSTVLVSKTDTTWGTFSETITASGTSLMLFLDHLNGSTSNKASAFDNVKITCTP